MKNGGSFQVFAVKLVNRLIFEVF